MILWQKQAGAKWLTVNEELLEKIARRDLAIISRPGRRRSLVQVFCRTCALSARLRRSFGGTEQPLPRNYLTNHLRSNATTPIRIGRRLEIVNEALRSREAATRPQLIIPAAGAFGTGEHATTAMSLRLLERISRRLPPGWRLLDAGTGTGILALAAARFGAGCVLGLDHDPRALAHARANARLNRIRGVKFVRADLLSWKSAGRYDAITANLFSELLIAALPTFQRALGAEGHLIISGILREQTPAMVRALRRAHFHLEEKRRRGKWVALLCAPKLS